MREKRGL